MKFIYPIFFFIIGVPILTIAQSFPLSTTSDSARYYYYKGWENVMDLGHYSKSAIAFKKCVDKDPNFLIGQCLYGRISEDLAEQEQIYGLIEVEKHNLRGAEYQLLAVFQSLLKLMIIRQKEPSKATQQIKHALALGETNFRQIVQQYPKEIYYKAEYIEMLNYNHGPKVALDSLAVLATPEEQQNPFLLGYAAMMKASLGQFDTALSKANQLAAHFEGQVVPKPYVVYADIYLKQGLIEKARENVAKALAIDAGNIDAQRLKKKLEKK